MHDDDKHDDRDPLDGPRDGDDIDAAFEKAIEINDRPVLLEFVTSPDSEVWPMVPAGVSNDDIVYARSVRPTTDPFAA